MKVAIMGAGGQGCFFGACLANAGNNVTFIARGAPLVALKKNGVMLKSKKLGNMSPSIQARAEADLVARGYGVVLPEDHVDKFLEAFMGYAPWAKSAILQDLEAGRRLELEALVGSVVRLGRGCGVPSPINDTIYAALKPYEGGKPVLPKIP